MGQRASVLLHAGRCIEQKPFQHLPNDMGSVAGNAFIQNDRAARKKIKKSTFARSDFAKAVDDILRKAQKNRPQPVSSFKGREFRREIVDKSPHQARHKDESGLQASQFPLLPL